MNREVNPRVLAILIVLLTLVLMIACPGRAHAQSLKHDLITASLQFGDIVTTNKVIAQGGREANPLMRPFASSPQKLTVAKSLYTAYHIYSARKTARSHPKLARTIWLGVNIFQGYVVYHNVKEMRKQ